jgi:hypothetical protein
VKEALFIGSVIFNYVADLWNLINIFNLISIAITIISWLIMTTKSTLYNELEM